MDLKKKVVEKLKAKGMDIAEDLAMDVIDVAFEVAEEAIKESENKYDDMLLPAMPLAKSKLHELADKIDGEEG